MEGANSLSVCSSITEISLSLFLQLLLSFLLMFPSCRVTVLPALMIPFYRVNTSDICLISGWSPISLSIKHKQPLNYSHTQRPLSFLACSADLSECIDYFTLDCNKDILKQDWVCFHVCSRTCHFCRRNATRWFKQVKHAPWLTFYIGPEGTTYQPSIVLIFMEKKCNKVIKKIQYIRGFQTFWYHRLLNMMITTGDEWVSRSFDCTISTILFHKPPKTPFQDLSLKISALHVYMEAQTTP